MKRFLPSIALACLSCDRVQPLATPPPPTLDTQYALLEQEIGQTRVQLLSNIDRLAELEYKRDKAPDERLELEALVVRLQAMIDSDSDRIAAGRQKLLELEISMREAGRWKPSEPLTFPGGEPTDRHPGIRVSE